MITEGTILKAMKNLGLSRDEAIEMLKEDEAINKGVNPYPLTPDKEKASKKARSCAAGHRQKPVHRERKPNISKRMLISQIEDAIRDLTDEVTVTNVERQIDFTIDNTHYRIVLSAPRSYGRTFSQLPEHDGARAELQIIVQIAQFFLETLSIFPSCFSPGICYNSIQKEGEHG